MSKSTEKEIFRRANLEEIYKKGDLRESTGKEICSKEDFKQSF